MNEKTIIPGDCSYFEEGCGYPDNCICVKYQAQKKAEAKFKEVEYLLNSPKLETIFELQKSFLEKFHPDVDSLSPQKRAELLEKNVLYLFSELDEILRTLPFKDWKIYQTFDEKQLHKTRGEIVDALHFIVQMGIIAGMSASDMFKGYLEKNTENIIRQKLKY